MPTSANKPVGGASGRRRRPLARRKTNQESLYLVYSNFFGTISVTPLADHSVLVGRSPQARISIPDPAVSRRHCEISTENSRWYVKDLGSRNGTYLNLKPVRRKRRLRKGDCIRVGRTHIIRIAGGGEERHEQ